MIMMTAYSVFIGALRGITTTSLTGAGSGLLVFSPAMWWLLPANFTELFRTCLNRTQIHRYVVRKWFYRRDGAHILQVDLVRTHANALG